MSEDEGRTDGEADGDGGRSARALRACYRLQLTAEFGFLAAAERVPYLAELGVSHLYLSPILAAVPGSTHGYDVVGHDRLSDGLGGDAAFRQLVEAAHGHGLGLVVDIVPNHMAVHPDNRQWWDVLRFGRGSPYEGWFDIFWEHGSDEVPDRLLLPILGDHYGASLSDGSIALDVSEGLPVVRVAWGTLPLSVSTTVEVLRDVAAAAGDPELRSEVERLAAYERA